MLHRKRAARPTRQVPRPAPFAIEGLEGRTFFTVTLVFDADGNAGLRVVGTNGNDSITITDNPVTDQPTVIGAGVVPDLGGNDILFYDIVTSGGADIVTFAVPTDYNFDIRGIAVDLGSGNDDFVLSFQGVVGAAGITVEIEGGSGKDTIGSNVLNIEDASTLDVLINAGADSDVVATSVNDVLGGSSYTEQVYLGTGTTNSYDGTLGFVEDGPTSAEYTVRGDGGADTVTHHLVDDIAGFLEINSFLGKGHDTQTLDIGSFPDFSGIARLDMNGDAGNDKLNVLLDRTNTDFEIGGVPGISGLDINMQGGEGNDALTLDLIRDTDLETFLDGNLRVRMSGGSGSDTIISKLQWDSGSTGRADLRFNGDGGNDLFKDFTLIDNSGGGLSYTGGLVLVDAGSGIDTRDGTNVVGVSVGINSTVVFLRFDNVINTVSP